MMYRNASGLMWTYLQISELNTKEFVIRVWKLSSKEILIKIIV